MELKFDPDPISQEQDPSILEWARAQRACVDYETELLYTGNFLVPSNDDFDRYLHDPSNATIISAVSALIKERLAVDKNAALLLKAVHSLREVPTTDPSATSSQMWIRGLKQELPVLQSDHQLDLLSFGNLAVPDFKTLQIPSEVTVEQNDEGFGWPTKYFSYPAQCDAQVKAEKLAVTREVLAYLQEAIRDAYIPEDGEKIEAEGMIRKQVGKALVSIRLLTMQKSIVRPVTPPLLPLSPPVTPYIPSSPANRLPLASYSSDSVTVEAQALHDQIMAADSLLRKDSDSSDSMLLDITNPPNFDTVFEVSTLLTLKRRAEDLKVEGPLTPPMFSTSPMRKLKTVSFADTLHEYIPYEPWGQDLVTGEGNKSGIESDEFFQEIEALAEQARRGIDRERLSGADTIARVNIPEVDFSLPIAPWNEYNQQKGGKHRPGGSELQAQMNFISRIKREDLKSATSWHGLSVLERELKWGFLNTKVSTPSLQEKLHGESEMTKIITEAETSDFATSSAQVWKREGLRILDEDENEEELDPEEDNERWDMEALIRKRKLEMEEEMEEKHRKRTSAQKSGHLQIQPLRVMQQSHHFEGQGPVPISTIRSKTMNHASQRPQAPKDASGDLIFGGFSASTALHKFMKTRGKPVDPAKVSTSEAPDLKGYARSRQSSHRPATQDQQAQTVNKPLPTLPAVPSNLAPCSFVISSTFLQQRRMLKQIEQTYPKAEMVYRDYTLPHSVAREADIILSPSTGLIFTTLQQVKQRALPGQPDRSPVNERMMTLQLRYERLVVLVGEGLSREMEELGSSRPDDPRDTEALKAFEEFASKLEGDVVVRYVRGGEKALARSTVVEMVNYGLPHGSVDIGDIKPIAQETSWEVFLRRVGFNPFAAQAIVAWLQKPLNVPVVPTHHAKTVLAIGLPRFILMDREERIRSFQALMGGSRVLITASKLMDQAWVSAVHGFRM
ncbi:uncharacterized protein ALTATR162_LOCUS6417 [Alternaria atra]|uniref:Uncharacterized protein n=1 Tax=Alternaria atra TaxID=119953 RepID=A0A8J2I9L4_9PLEO|nr:uncharacterized protein ALTATR162_LOCUS6417 [Alternaria atra]CAG5163354.1 unnamed protein product [Alternaria atra]